MSHVPKKWVEVPLGALGVWRGGGTPSKMNAGWWQDGTVPWISPKDMKFELIIDSQDKVSTEAINDGAAELIPSGSLLIVTRSGILAHSTPTAVTQVEVAINQDIKALIPATGISAAFLAAQIRARSAELLAHARKAGTTVESLILERLQSFPILLAPERQQLYIADQLSRIRARVQAVITAFETVTRTVARLREALADKVVKRELTASGVPTRSAIDDVKVRDLLLEPSRTGLSIRGRLEPPGVRALRLSALRRPVVDMQDIRHLQLEEERVNHLLLKAGDILISRGSGTRAFVGRASLVQKVFEPTIFPDTAYRLRLDQTRVLPEWFVAVWNAPATRRAFEARIRTTAGIWKVAWKDLGEVTLAVPPPAEQADALEALHAATGRLDLALTKRDRGLRAIERYEQTMLRRAFEGHLIAVSAQDEDAALIVARAQQQPARIKRTARKPQMPNPREAFQKMVVQWPEAGLSFGEVRNMLPGRYEDLKEVVFEAIDRGLIKQCFDSERCAMILLRRTS